MADIEKNIIIKATTETKKAEQDLKGLKGATKEVELAVDKATHGMLSSLKKLAKNPYVAAIGLAISAVIAVFKKLKEAIKNNDDAGTSFARLFAILKTPLTLVNKLFNQLADILGKLADTYANLLSKLLPKKWREQAEAEDELVKATDRLEEAEREYALKSAERARDISELRLKASQKDKYTIKERIKFLSEAIQKEQEEARAHKKLVDDKIRNFELEHRNEKSWSDATKDAYNELKIEKVNADNAMLASQRKLNTAMSPLVDQLIQQAGDLSNKYDDIVQSIKSVYAETLNLQLTETLKDSREQIEALTRQLLFGPPETVVARNNIILGLSKANAEGAKLVIDGIKTLNDIIDSNDPLRPIVDGLLPTYEAISNIIEEVGKTEQEAQKKASEARAAANQKEADNAKREENKRIADARQASEEAYRVEKERLEKLWKENKDYYAKLALLVLEHNHDVEKLQQQRADAEEKLANAKTDAEREAYQALIDAINNKLADMMAEYEKRVERATELLNSDPAVFAFVEANDKLKEAVQARKEILEENLKNEINSRIVSAKEEQKYREMSKQDREAWLKYLKDNGLTYELKEYLEIEKDIQKQADKTKQMSQDTAKYSLDILSSFASTAGSIAQLYQNEYQKIVAGKDELSEEEKEQAITALERQKTATLAQIALQQAMSIGNTILAATSAAASTGPLAPFVYAATLATIMAGVISSFVQAKQSIGDIDDRISELKGYAVGGYIEGAGTSTSDSIPARLSNGEAVINARSTSMYYDLLSKINQAGGGVAFPNAQNTPILRFANGGVANTTTSIVEAVKTAVKDIQPVVSVKEITRVQNKLKLKEM